MNPSRFLVPHIAFVSLACAAFAAASPAVWAQQTPPLPALVPAASGDAIAGPIRKADTVRVLVAGADNLGGDFKVEADGTVFLPSLGQIDVAGKSPREAAQVVAQQIEAKKLLKKADVAVYITQRKAREVIINGAVGVQGRQPIKEATVLSEALEASGPLTGADLTRVVITRNGQEMTVNYKKYQSGQANGTEFNPLLEDGDRIYVYSGTPGEGIVRVLGEVKEAAKTTVPITQGTTVGQVLQSAGGVTDYADRSNIFVQRGTEKIPVPYDEILRNPAGKDIALRDKDEINVPRLERIKQITVGGAVVKPDSFPLRTRVTLLDAVAQAGGTQDGAQQNKVEVRRRTEKGAIKTTVFDMRKDDEAATELRDGDYVFVPYGKRQNNNVGAAAGILGGLGALFGIFRR